MTNANLTKLFLMGTCAFILASKQIIASGGDWTSSSYADAASYSADTSASTPVSARVTQRFALFDREQFLSTNAEEEAFTHAWQEAEKFCDDNQSNLESAAVELVQELQQELRRVRDLNGKVQRMMAVRGAAFAPAVAPDIDYQTDEIAAYFLNNDALAIVAGVDPSVNTVFTWMEQLLRASGDVERLNDTLLALSLSRRGA